MPPQDDLVVRCLVAILNLFLEWCLLDIVPIVLSYCIHSLQTSPLNPTLVDRLMILFILLVQVCRYSHGSAGYQIDCFPKLVSLQNCALATHCHWALCRPTSLNAHLSLRWNLVHVASFVILD